MRDLRPNSSLLISLNQSFPDACKDIKIISCYETEHTRTYLASDPTDPNSKWEKTGPPRFMVPPTSACLDWPKAKETKVAIHADHSGIAQLNNSPGSAYYQIKSEIMELVEGAPDVLKRRKESGHAAQDTLSLLFMLQYEYSWLRAWLSHTSGQPPHHESFADIIEDENDLQSLSKVPYGHPAYPVVTNISLLLQMLSALVTKHRIPPQSASIPNQPKDVGSRAASPHTHLSAPPIMFSFSSETDNGWLNAESDRNAHVYDVEHWSNSDREQFGYLVFKFHVENDQLSQLSRHTTSLDLIASSKVLSKFPHGLEHVERISRASQIHTSLSKRAALKRQYQEAGLRKDNSDFIYPISWIKMKEGSGSSNYRIVTSLHDRSPYSSAGETLSIIHLPKRTEVCDSAKKPKMGTRRMEVIQDGKRPGSTTPGGRASLPACS